MATRGASQAHMRRRHVGGQTEAWLARCQREQRPGRANSVVLWMRNSKPFPTQALGWGSLRLTSLRVIKTTS